MSKCELCDESNQDFLVMRGNKTICYGCEHEIFYADRDKELMETLYADY